MKTSNRDEKVGESLRVWAVNKAGPGRSVKQWQGECRKTTESVINGLPQPASSLVYCVRHVLYKQHGDQKQQTSNSADIATQATVTVIAIDTPVLPY